MSAACALALLGLLLLAGPAFGAASVDTFGSGSAASLGVFGDDEADDIEVTGGPLVFTVTNPAGLTTSNCSQVDSTTVRCSSFTQRPGAVFVSGGSGDDEIAIDAGDQPTGLGGDCGSDVIRGGDGDDLFEDPFSDDDGTACGPLPGSDDFFGGAGIDAVSYRNLDFSPVRVDLEGDRDDGPAGVDKIGADVENIIGSRAQGDELIGNDGDNVIDPFIPIEPSSATLEVMQGGGGNDTFVTRGGNSTMDGGPGNDTFGAGGSQRPDDNNAAPDQDTITGGEGRDRVDYSGVGATFNSTPVTVDLHAGSGNGRAAAGGDPADDDVFTDDLEDVTTSGVAGDEVRGNDLDNQIDLGGSDQGTDRAPSCAAGFDEVRGGPEDTVADDCEDFDDGGQRNRLTIESLSTSEEGTGGAAQAEITVTRASRQGSTTIGYATQDGDATVEGGDYAATSGTLEFAPGKHTKQVTVAITGDAIDENDTETFGLAFSDPVNGTVVSNATAIVTIEDDDDPPAADTENRLSIGDVAVTEDNSGTVEARLTVTRTDPVGTSTVSFATADGSATQPGDYSQAAGTLEFVDPKRGGDDGEGVGISSAAEITQTATVIVNGDAVDEPDETFTVVLSDPQNATIVDGLGTATVVDDDTPAGGGDGGDGDSDGVVDASDNCPTQAGPAANGGCPVSTPPPDTTPPPGDTIPPPSGGDTGPTDAQIEQVLADQVNAAAKDLKQLGLDKLLAKGTFKAEVTALEPGDFAAKLTGSVANKKSVTIAKGKDSFAGIDKGKVKLKLTADGEKLLKKAKQAKDAVKGTLQLKFSADDGNTAKDADKVRLK